MNFLIKRNEKSINCSITSGNTKEIKESTLKAAKTLLEAYKGKFRKIRANGMDSVRFSHFLLYFNKEILIVETV